MDDLITIKRSDLHEIVTITVREVMRELQRKPPKVEAGWISFNEAVQINPKKLGRKRIERAIAEGLIREKMRVTHDNPFQCRLLSRRDVEECILERKIR